MSTARVLLHTNATLLHLQIHPGNEGRLAGNVLPTLRTRVLSSHEFMGSGPAKRAAAERLSQDWGDAVGFEVLGELLAFFRGSVQEALERSPRFSVPKLGPNGKPLPGEFEDRFATLETRPSEVKRVHETTSGPPLHLGRHNITKTVGDPLSGLVLRDTRQPVYVSLPGHPQWFYWTSAQTLIDSDQIVKDIVGDIAANTQAAAGVLRFIVATGAFSMGMSARISMQIGSFLLDRGIEFADGRSPQEVIKSGGFDLLGQLALGRVFGGGGRKSGGVGRTFEDRTAAAVRHELKATDDKLVAEAIERGGYQPVRDSAMVAKGYEHKVRVNSEGQSHTYFRNKAGTWCRKTVEICDIELDSAEVKARMAEIEKIRSNAPRRRETLKAWVRRTTPDWDTLPPKARQQALKAGVEKMATARRRKDLLDKVRAHQLTLDRVYSELNRVNAKLQRRGALSKDEVAELVSERDELVKELNNIQFPKKANLLDQLERTGASAYERARAYSYSATASNVVTNRALVDRGKGIRELVDEYSGKAIKEPSIDHIVPVARIAAMKCFAALPPQAFRDVLSNTNNLKMMEKTANSSKGERSWSEWGYGRVLYGPIVYEKMVSLERQLLKDIQQDILNKAARAKVHC